MIQPPLDAVWGVTRPGLHPMLGVQQVLWLPTNIHCCPDTDSQLLYYLWKFLNTASLVDLSSVRTDPVLYLCVNNFTHMSCPIPYAANALVLWPGVFLPFLTLNSVLHQKDRSKTINKQITSTIPYGPS